MNRMTVSAFARTTMLNTLIRGAMLPCNGRILPASHIGITPEFPRFIAARRHADGGTTFSDGLGGAWYTQPDGFSDGAVAEYAANRTVEVHERDVSRSRMT